MPVFFSRFAVRSRTLREQLARVIKDVLLHGGADGRLLNNHEEMAPSLETDQSCARNGGSSELGIVVNLECVVCGMQDQGAGPGSRQPSHSASPRVVESNAGGSRRNRVHVINNPVNQVPLPGNTVDLRINHSPFAIHHSHSPCYHAELSMVNGEW